MRSKKLTLALALWVAVVFVSIRWGAVSELPLDLLLSVRLPRVLLASVVGAGLAVAGAVLQAVFTNPLCEPYTLGISSGAAFGAVIGVSLGYRWNLGGIVGMAFLGSLFFTLILHLVSKRAGSTQLEVLLTGVMLGFLGSSLVALWQAVADSNGIQGAILWLMGDLSGARISGLCITSALVSGLVFFIWRHSSELDTLLLGEEVARAIGVEVADLRKKLIFLTAVIIGVCVSTGGMIGFVGLVVPHFCRRLMGALHAKLIPACAIYGAVALTGADFFSRVILSPRELPVGVVTALIGVPILFSILLKRKLHHG